MERLHIAVAEDNPSDVVTLRQLLDRIGLEYRLTVAAEGEEARDFILKQACSERERRSIDQHFAPKKIYYIAKPLDEKHLLACLLSYDNLRPIAERLAKQ